MCVKGHSMEIVKYSNRIIHTAHENSLVDEYMMQNKDIDVCIVTVSGRTPTHGQMINREYTCVCYCINGTGTVCGQSVTKGDAFNILSGEKYWFDGNFKFVMCGTPAFNPNQNYLVE